MKIKTTMKRVLDLVKKNKVLTIASCVAALSLVIVCCVAATSGNKQVEVDSVMESSSSRPVEISEISEISEVSEEVSKAQVSEEVSKAQVPEEVSKAQVSKDVIEVSKNTEEVYFESPKNENATFVEITEDIRPSNSDDLVEIRSGSTYDRSATTTAAASAQSKANKEAKAASEAKAKAEAEAKAETSKPEITKPETSKPEISKPETSKPVEEKVPELEKNLESSENFEFDSTPSIVE